MLVDLPPADAVTVAAILMTHAEMQDLRIHETSSVLARLKRDEPGTPMIDDLEDTLQVIEDDVVDLKRIAAMFGVQ